MSTHSKSQRLVTKGLLVILGLFLILFLYVVVRSISISYDNTFEQGLLLAMGACVVGMVNKWLLLPFAAMFFLVSVLEIRSYPHATCVPLAIEVWVLLCWNLPFVAACILCEMFHRWRLTEKRARSGECARCGYSLTGNASGICPECGTSVGLSPPTLPDDLTPSTGSRPADTSPKGDLH